ncbi:MAG: V-type ATP synthase subunit F [Clostridia bacterium]
MKMFCISDNVDTALGMGLAGMNTAVLHEKKEIEQKLEDVLKDSSIGILVITDKIYQEVYQAIDKIKQERRTPLVVTIPDRHIKKQKGEEV